MPTEIPAFNIPATPSVPIQLDIPPINVINPNPPQVVAPDFNAPNQGMGIISIGPHSLNHGCIYELVEIEMTRTLGEFPSCTVTYYSLESNTPEIGSNLSILGVPFIIDSINVSQYLQTNPMAYVITLNLISIHASRGSITQEHELDRPIRFDSDTTSLDWSAIANKITTPINIGNTQYKRYFDGQSEVLITPRSELESAFLTATKFIPYYSSAQIEGVNPSTGNGTITLDNRYILSETLAIDNKNTPYYLDTEITLEVPFDEELQDNSAESITRYEFENCIDISDLKSPRVPGMPPDAALTLLSDELKDVGNNFDTGGRTKRMRKIKEIDGNPIKIEEEVWGYVFNSIHVVKSPKGNAEWTSVLENNSNFPVTYNVVPSNVELAWRQVETSTTDFSYDNDGYLKSSTKTTKGVARLKKESGDLEAFKWRLKQAVWWVTYKGGPYSEPGDGMPPAEKMKQEKAIAEKKAYLWYPDLLDWDSAFQTIPGPYTATTHTYTNIETTEYFLSKFDTYYTDTEVGEGEPPAKFASTIRNYSKSTKVEPNPQDHPDDPASPYPVLVIQQTRTEYTKTDIIIPASKSASKRSPELFVTTNYTQSIEGDFGVNSLRMGNSIQQVGRPSIHARIPKSSNGGSGSATEIVGGLQTPSIPVFPIDGNFIETTGSNTDNPPEENKRYFINPSQNALASTSPIALSSVGWGGIASTSAAKKAADNNLLREYIYAHTMQINIIAEPYQQIKEGNILIIDNVRWLIITVQVTYKAIAPYQFQAEEGLQLTLGLIPNAAPQATVQSVT